MTARPELVDVAPADVFRDGLDEERRQLADIDWTSREVLAQIVLARRQMWETEIETWHRRTERLQGRMEADNQWLAEHPDGVA